MKLATVILLAVTANSLPFGFSEWNIAAKLNPFRSNSLEKRLIKLGENEFQVVSEAEKLALRRRNVNFIDVTNHISIDDAISQGMVDPSTGGSLYYKLLGAKQLSSIREVPVYNYPKKTSYNEEVFSIFEKISIPTVKENLATFSSFFTRYYKSESGLESADWLFGKIIEIIEPVDDKVSITRVQHQGWDQYSIIVSIPGKTSDKVVLGCHQDSINLLLPNILKAPGADDDGSGTVTVLETLRLIIDEYASKSFKPYNTLEFHFYSAEEGGLLGSYDVFSRYAINNETVVAMLQQDMTGSTEKTIAQGIEPHFGLITDNVCPYLVDFLKLVVETYNSIPYHETSCGYACSDHASALEHGFPSTFLIESEMKYSSGYIHSVLDTVDRIDFDHVHEHVKLSVAYAYELAHAKLEKVN